MKNSKHKIFFVLPTLSAGGAERIMTFLSKNIDPTIFDSTLIILGYNTSIAYDIKEMNVVFLNQNRVLYAIPKLIGYIYRNKPQIVMGSIVHLNIGLGLISILFPKIIFVGRQASISKVTELYNDAKPNQLFKILSKYGLNALDYVICQSSDMYKDCLEVFKIKEKKLRIIHNPITDNFHLKTNDHFIVNGVAKFITIGRLVKIKGHQRILNVLSKLQIPFQYTIIGNGPEKEAIKNQIALLNLNEKVEFIDFDNDVAKHLAQNDFYLQGSFAEGFPNALLESCAVGTPVIAFAAPGGTKDIIEDGINGYLVKDEQDFLGHLNNLHYFDPKQVSYSVHQKFNKKIILKTYENFFKNILGT